MEDLRLRNNSSKSFSSSSKLFGKQTFIAFSSFFRELKPVYKDNRFQRIIWLGLFNFLSLLLLLTWCNTTQSVGLQSFVCLIYFDILCLSICVLSIWVEQKKPNSLYSFGYERLEVLAIFAATTYTFLNSLFLIKYSIWRWFANAGIKHSGLMFPGIFLAFLCHSLVTFFMKNKGLNLVICASNFSWIQTRVSSFKQSLNHVVPGMVANPRPRINPLSVLGCVIGTILVFMVLLIDMFNFRGADALAGIAVSLLICLTMYPLIAYSGKILLQGTPEHVKDLLDKRLREVSTLEGVLEFRKEHFWLLGFDKIVGTLHVRIRRDANEQVVLSHLLNKLSSLVADITIQIFKEEFTWNTTPSATTRIVADPSYLKFPDHPTSYATPIAPTLPPKQQDIKVTLTPPLPPALTAAPPHMPVKTNRDMAIDMSSAKYGRELIIDPLMRQQRS